jgi:hypothetical protein
MCEEWRDFAAFAAWALANGYQPGLSIERNDNDLGYSPENCKWIPKNRQGHNTRKSRRITAFGETKPVIDWVEDPRCSVGYCTLWSRLVKHGWDAERAISVPRLRPGTRASRLA